MTNPAETYKADVAPFFAEFPETYANEGCVPMIFFDIEDGDTTAECSININGTMQIGHEDEMIDLTEKMLSEALGKLKIAKALFAEWKKTPSAVNAKLTFGS